MYKLYTVSKYLIQYLKLKENVNAVYLLVTPHYILKSLNLDFC